MYCGISPAGELAKDPLSVFLYASKRCSERPCSALLEPPSLESSSPLLYGSSFSDTGRPMRSVPLLFATLPFQLRRIVHLGRPYAPVREGSMYLFPRAAIVPHLEQYCILFWCLFSPFSTPFLKLQRYLMSLARCSSFVIGRNLCWRLLTRTDFQCFRINRKVKEFRD
jgi:hypothetical protein